MSLLMEALRKAELEKKKAAQRLEQTVEHAQVTEHADAKAGPQHPVSDVTAEHITRLDPTLVRSKEELLAATAQLSLAPIDARNAGAVPHPRAAHDGSEDQTLNVLMDQVSAKAVEDTLVNLAVPEMEETLKTPALAEELDIGADSPLDESFHEPVIDISRELPGIYDETIQGEAYRPSEPERSYDETLPGVSAAELARDLGEENQPTPVAAQTIFTATATTQSAASYKWPLIIGLSAVVVVALGIIVYQASTPLVREIPTDQLAQDLDLTRLPPADAITPPAATPPAMTTAPPLSTAEQPAVTETTPAVTEIVTPAAATASTEAQTGAPPVTVAAAAAEPAGSETVPAPVAGAEDTAPLVLQPGLIRISRSKAPDDRGLLVNDAYAAYSNGDYATASQKYAEVLKAFPDNRDALLGLGAIAMQEGDAARVVEIYTRLFKLDPTDKFARAVLVNLDNTTDPVSRESALKIMISGDPGNAFLYFTLGNVYAAQSRWSAAQQAFFDAYSRDSNNADYALNLAISLDRIGQSKTALDYYHTALQLADQRAGQFDSANVLARIQTLTEKTSN